MVMSVHLSGSAATMVDSSIRNVFRIGFFGESRSSASSSSRARKGSSKSSRAGSLSKTFRKHKPTNLLASSSWILWNASGSFPWWISEKWSGNAGQKQSIHFWSIEKIEKLVKILMENTHRCDFLVNLGRIGAFAIRVLGSKHLQDTHTEGIYVNQLVVFLLVQFRRHELRCTCEVFGKLHTQYVLPPSSFYFIFNFVDVFNLIKPIYI